MYIPQPNLHSVLHKDPQGRLVRFLVVFNIFMLLLFIAKAHADQPQGEPLSRYTFDKSHTAVLFKIDHLGYSHMIGRFNSYEGFFEFDPQRPEQSRLEVTVYPESVDTNVPVLNEKLQGAVYFNTLVHPTATFVSRSVEVTGDNTGVVHGDFTLLGVTQHLSLDVTFNKADKNPFSELLTAGFSAKGELFRSAYNMTELLPHVGDKVELMIEVEGFVPEEQE